MPLRNPLLDKYKNGGTALGVIVNSADMIEVCAKVGFDWVEIDQMFTAFDWHDVQYMIRTAEAAGVTPVIRIQSYPWLGYDHRIPVDVSRALAIGAQFVMVSHSGKREIEECLSLAGDWHRKALWLHPYKSFDDWDTVTEEMKEGTFIIPQPETMGALADLDETLTMPGVKMLFFAMGDLSKLLSGTVRPDWYNPRLWEHIHRAVALARERGVMIGAVTSYAYDLNELAKRVRKMHEAGIRMIMLPGVNFVTQLVLGNFVDGVRRELRLDA
jgi:4-hydroxy-2-oxoheptanedioate aldolase